MTHQTSAMWLLTIALAGVVASIPSFATACIVRSGNSLSIHSPSQGEFGLVAKVRILRIVHPFKYKDDFDRLIEIEAEGSAAIALVTEAIRGATVGEHLLIAQATGCNEPFSVDAVGYVASKKLIEINGSPAAFVEVPR